MSENEKEPSMLRSIFQGVFWFLVFAALIGLSAGFAWAIHDSIMSSRTSDPDDEYDRYALKVDLRNDVATLVNFSLIIDGQLVAEGALELDGNFTYWWLFCEDDGSHWSNDKDVTVQVLTDHATMSRVIELEEMSSSQGPEEVPVLTFEVGFTEVGT